MTITSRSDVFLKAYSYVWDLIALIKERKPLPVQIWTLIGGRFSGKTTNAAMRFWIIAAIIGADYGIRIGAQYNRASVEGMRDSGTDFLSELDTMGVPYKKSEAQKMVYVGLSEIRFVGVNSLKVKDKGVRAGSYRFACDYLFKIYDETYEFKQHHYNALEEAIRHKGDVEPHYLTINCCNPGLRSNWFIKQNEKVFRFNEHILRNSGSQIGTTTYTTPEGLTLKTLHHYTNGRVAQEVLSKAQIASVQRYWAQGNIQRARVADFGLPGLEEGGIYIHELHKIGEPVYVNENQGLLAGMDYGGSQREAGGKTVCLFLSATMRGGIDVFGEYTHDNAEQVITHNLLADNVVVFYIKQVEKGMLKLGRWEHPQIQVRCDNANIAMVQLLNNVASQKGVSHGLTFIPCVKYPVPDRIASTLSLMSNQRLRVSKDCFTLLSEFEDAHYEEKTDQKRAKENDHALNAFEYAIEPVMYRLAQEMGLDAKQLRKKRGYFYA